MPELSSHRLLLPEQVETFYGITRQRLEKGRERGFGPAFIKEPGTRRVFYRVADIEAWIAANRRQSTSELAAEAQ